MMNLKKVAISGMHNVEHKTYTFNDITYICGKNGVGKSTILQAIQFALLGYIPGYGKTKSETFKHCNGTSMTVVLTLTDGDTDVTIERCLMRSGTSIKDGFKIMPEHYSIENIVGNVELPVFNFSEFKSMTANKLKDWFIDFLPKNTEKIDWYKELRSCITDPEILDPSFIEYTVSELSEISSSGVECVRNANEILKETLSAEKKTLAMLSNTINGLIYYDDCDMESTEEELQAQIQQIESTKNVYMQMLNKIRTNDTMKHEIENLMNTHNVGNVSDLLVVINMLQDKIQEVSDKIMRIKEDNLYLTGLGEHNESIIHGNTVCQYTGKVCDSITAMIPRLQEDNMAIMERIKNNNTELNTLSTVKQKYTEELSKVEADKDYAISLDSRIEYLKSNITDISETYEDVEAKLNTLSVKLTEKLELLSKVKANNLYNAKIDTITRDKAILEQNIKFLDAWIKHTGINGMQSTMARTPFIDFSGKMTKYLSVLFDDKGYTRAAFNLSEKANSFSFGVYTKNNQYIEYDLLSSGEKCLFTLAMLLCITQSSNVELKLILIDDLFDHLDTDRFNKVLTTFNTVTGTQCIIAGVQEVNTEYTILI